MIHKVRKRFFATDILRVGLFLSLVLLWKPTSCITMSAPKEVDAVKGETVTLACSFTSTSLLTSKISVDWSYRPQDGGPSNIFFYFSSIAYPPKVGQFTGRVHWQGNPARGDATIQLLNATLNDNGTYSCTVRNPPDVHGTPADTTLTVSPRKSRVWFSDVAVLMLLIIVPSVMIAMGLLVRMFYLCCSPPTQSYHLDHHSPIEVTDGDKYSYRRVSPKKSSEKCCEMYLQNNTDDIPPTYKKNQVQMVEESQC